MSDESMRLPLPAAMVARARDFTGPPAPVRAAATVVLLRPAEHNLEVYVLKRASTMVFGGVYAFPGGTVDPGDRPETLREDWPERLGVAEEQARAVIGAAARELFEEAGVLLAGTGDSVVGQVSGPEWEADRAAVLARELTMTELLARRGLRLRDDLLFPWSRWVTPEFEPRRYDTWFFVSALPDGQTARDVSGESDGTDWISPAAANGLNLLPPTLSTLNDLRPYRRVVDVLTASAHRDAASPVMPRLELTGDGGFIRVV